MKKLLLLLPLLFLSACEAPKSSPTPTVTPVGSVAVSPSPTSTSIPTTSSSPVPRPSPSSKETEKIDNEKYEALLPLIPCATWDDRNAFEFNETKKIGAYYFSVEPSCIIFLNPQEKAYGVFEDRKVLPKQEDENAVMSPFGFSIVSVDNAFVTVKIWKVTKEDLYTDLTAEGPLEQALSFTAPDAEWSKVAKYVETKKMPLTFKKY